MPISGEKMTFRTILREGRAFLSHSLCAKDADPAFEAFLLFQKVFGLTRERYLAEADSDAPRALFPEYEELLRRRAAGEPVQYLLGEWEFMGLPFTVGPGVLIPRPETELLAEDALAFLKNRPRPRILELCGGSGCLAVSLGVFCPEASVVTVELSEEALPYLRENVRRNAVQNVEVLAGDALSPPGRLLEEQFDLILSNPPYIAEEELPTLQKEVQQEPRMALWGGTDGLLFYQAFCRLYPPLLVPGGQLAFEIGETQEAAVSALLKEAGLSQITVQNDLAGLPRVVTGQKPNTL